MVIGPAGQLAECPAKTQSWSVVAWYYYHYYYHYYNYCYYYCTTMVVMVAIMVILTNTRYWYRSPPFATQRHISSSTPLAMFCSFQWLGGIDDLYTADNDFRHSHVLQQMTLSLGLHADGRVDDVIFPTSGTLRHSCWPRCSVDLIWMWVISFRIYASWFLPPFCE